MADAGALHQHAVALRDGKEDEKFTYGVLVVDSPTHGSAPIGQFYLPDRSKLKCLICKQEGHKAADCLDKDKVQACKVCGSHAHAKPDCPQVTCGNCFEQGHQKDRCTNPPVCDRCKEVGHIRVDCPLRKLCKNCQQRGHTANNCSNPAKCKNCGENGHVAADCSKPLECSNCGDQGHLMRDCFAGPTKKVSPPSTLKRDAVKGKTPSSTDNGSWGNNPSSSADNESWGNNPSSSANTPPRAPPPDETPAGTLTTPPGQQLTVKFVTTLTPKHVSSLRFQLEGSYPNPDSPTAKNDQEHKSASIIFTRDNIARGENIFVKVVDQPIQRSPSLSAKSRLNSLCSCLR